MSSHNKRKVFSIEEKSAIIWRLEAGEPNSKLAAEFGVAHSTISTIWKNRETIRSCFESNALKTKRIKTATHEDIDHALFEWFKIQRSRNIPINGPMLQAKANDFAKILGKTDYSCSESWIYRFRMRHAIVFSQISGEANSAPSGSAEDWLAKVWPILRTEYKDSQIFNADEFGLFFRLTPNKTLTFKGEKCTGGKMSKDRITVMAAASLDGSVKRKLLVIGKSQKPRCFKNVKNLPVDYEANSKSWMTSVLFEKFLHKWDRELIRKKEKILLLVDNCPCHIKPQLQAIRLEFLPPNTTSILQPMDQGIIRSIKHHYRKSLVIQLIKNADANKSDSKVSILDAILMISKAWESVTPTTIRNCFKHGGFSTTDEDDVPLNQLNEHLQEPDVEELDDMIPLAQWIRNFDNAQNIASAEE